MNMEKNNPPAGKAQTEMLRKFNDRLATFPSQVGKRNLQLLGLVNYGIRSGLTDDEIEDAIVEKSGNPPLTLTEIRHTLDTAHKTTAGFKAYTNKPARSPLGPKACTFVSKMMEAGKDATLEKLASLSPVPIPEAGAEQTKLFLSTLYAETEYLFIGDYRDSGTPGGTIRSVTDWSMRSGLSGPFLIVNPLTGEKGTTKTGNPSYRCGQCIANPRYALVEFDVMSLEQQARFWGGVIASLTLPLRSLVHSGGKSIHGIVEIAAQTPYEWNEEMDKLMYAVAHPGSPCEQQADKTCRNPDRLSRLAGVVRPEKDALQRLLWISKKPLGI